MIPSRVAPHSHGRRGASLVEVLIVVVVVGLFGLVALMALPRGREDARLALCGRNLMQIGQALAWYDGAVGHLPMIPPAGEDGPGPLPTLLGQLGLGDLRSFDGTGKVPSGTPTATPSASFVAGFVCPSDPNARPGPFPAPVSYRADAGPGADGQGGPFSFGRVTRIAEAEAGAGADFTSAFSERLAGSGTPPSLPAIDYMEVPGPVGVDSCPSGSPESWRVDAGSTWEKAGWTSTLFNHALRPNASPSCLAADGRTARMGASSGHARRVNVLMLGGSVRGVTPDIDPEIWKTLGTMESRGRAAKPSESE